MITELWPEPKNRGGQRLVRAADDEPEMVLADIDPSARREARLRMPFLKEERPHLIQRELQRVLSERAAPRY